MTQSKSIWLLWFEFWLMNLSTRWRTFSCFFEFIKSHNWCWFCLFLCLFALKCWCLLVSVFVCVEMLMSVCFCCDALFCDLSVEIYELQYIFIASKCMQTAHVIKNNSQYHFIVCVFASQLLLFLLSESFTFFQF